ncbi:sigma-70 family RNA polymerase sigma factor [Methylomonas sp. AM2-LC]|uniref:RNA polymerase sigma factor n=1 Tax=Methylomonas sp. AM2-LC TaxID=3153301 RepID=UPI003264F458
MQNTAELRMGTEGPPGDQALASEKLCQDYIVRVIDSDQVALGLLYDHLVDYVYGLVLRITKQVPLAEEVVQDTFWQVWRQAPRYSPERGSVKAWVMTIARSRALDALRKIESDEIELDEETLQLIAASDADEPPNILVAVQQSQQLQSALADLEPVPRHLLSLSFFRGLSHDEIAVCSGLPLGTVKSHIRRGLQLLQQNLATQLTETF